MPNSIQMKPGSTTYYKMRMEITTAALDKYPDLPSRTLARLLHKQHPEIYVSVELARTAIRVMRGAHGQEHRKHLRNRNYVKPI